MLDRAFALFAGGQAIDDRSDRQAVAGQGLAIGARAVARRRSVPAAADERDATVAESDEMFGRERHAEPEIGADMIVVAPSEAAQHLNHRNAETIADAR